MCVPSADLKLQNLLLSAQPAVVKSTVPSMASLGLDVTLARNF
jgi:hypothetical protein